MSAMLRNQTHSKHSGGGKNAPRKTNLAPLYVRLPRIGFRCEISGLSRTALYALCKSGAVKSAVVKQPGTKRGIRLVNYKSLVSYLESLETGSHKSLEK